MTVKKMSELDEIKHLLKNGEEEKAFEVIKDKDKNLVAKGLIKNGENEGYDLAIIYFKFSEKIATDSDIKEDARRHLRDVYFKRGNAYDKKGNFDSAIKDFKEVIRLNPDTPEAYYNCGNAYHKKKEFDRAIENYNKAIELKPDLDIAHANLGDSLYRIKDYDNAEKGYRAAIRINNNNDYALKRLGLVLSKRKAYKEAIEEFKKVSKRDKDADFYNNLGCAYVEYGKGSAMVLFKFLKGRKNLRKATK